MPRQIKIGDRVQSFLSPEINGEVVDIFFKNLPGKYSDVVTTNKILTYKVKLKNGNFIDCNSGDIFITDYK